MVDSLDTKEVGKTLDQLKKELGNTVTILENSNVEVYTKNVDGKNCKNINGICCVIFDRKEGKCTYLRAYDQADLKLLFSMEVHHGFSDCWNQLMPNFYTITSHGGYIGFLFPSPVEAIKITDKIIEMTPNQEDYEKKLKKEEDIKKQEKKEKASKTIFGLAMDLFTSKKEDQKAIVSTPTQFKHSVSVKLDPITGQVDLDNLPEEYKTIFKKAGITKKQLRDKDYAEAIFSAIAQYKDDPSALDQKSPVQQFKQQDQLTTKAQMKEDPTAWNKQIPENPQNHQTSTAQINEDFAPRILKWNQKLPVKSQTLEDDQILIHQFNEIPPQRNQTWNQKAPVQQQTQTIQQTVAKINEIPPVQNQSQPVKQQTYQDDYPIAKLNKIPPSRTQTLPVYQTQQYPWVDDTIARNQKQPVQQQTQKSPQTDDASARPFKLPDQQQKQSSPQTDNPPERKQKIPVQQQTQQEQASHYSSFTYTGNTATPQQTNSKQQKCIVCQTEDEENLFLVGDKCYCFQCANKSQ